MKNLRKVLALVLVVASLMGMAVMTNAADFTDVAKISQSNKEAVDVLSALDIIGGYTDGSYQPKKVVTRAEMAKMIATILNSGKDINNLYKASCTFADSKDHWAAGYIGYCATMGIINGRSESVFDPNATVTGVEAAKMVLGALKYKAEAEGFTGTTWKGNVLNVVDELDLYERISTNPDEGMTRENAAQLLWNGMQQKTVKYTGGSSITVDGVTFVSGGERSYNANTLLADKFAGVSSVRGYNQWHQPITTITVPGEEDIVIVDTPDLTALKPIQTKEVYKLVGNIKGVDLAKNGIVVNVHAGGFDITNSNCAPYFWNIVGGAANATSYTQGDGTVVTVSKLSSKNNGMTSSSTAGLGTNSDITQIYWDADAKVLDVIVFWTGAAKIETVEEDDGVTTITTAAGYGYGNLAGKTFEIATAETEITEDNEGDIVVGSAARVGGNAGDYTIYDLYLPTVVTGISEGTVLNSSNKHSSLYMSGKTYTCDGNIDSAKSGAFTVGEEFNVYLCKGGFAQAFMSVVEAEQEAEYVYVLDTATEQTSFGEPTYLAKVLFADGVVEIIETKALATKNTLCSYTVAKNVYTLTSVADTTTELAVVKGQAAIGSYFANNNTVFVVETIVDGESVYNVYTGIKNVPSMTKTNALVIENEETEGLVDIMFCLASELASSSAATDLDISMLYIPTGLSKYTKVGVDGEAYAYYSVKAWINGAATTLKLSESLYASLKGTANVPASLKLIKGYTADDNGVVTSIATASAGLTAITSGTANWKNGVITINGAPTYIEEGTPVYFYERNSSAMEAHTIEKLDVSTDSKETIQGGWYLTDANGAIIAVYGMGKIS